MRALIYLCKKYCNYFAVAERRPFYTPTTISTAYEHCDLKKIRQHLIPIWEECTYRGVKPGYLRI